MEKNWTKLTEDKATWPSLEADNDVWLRDEDGNTVVGHCFEDQRGRLGVSFTNCVESTNALKWATHWAPASPPPFDGED